MTFDPADFRLRDNLPRSLVLSVGTLKDHPPANYLWHTERCRQRWANAPAENWIGPVPTELAERHWPAHQPTDEVGYCQLCVIKRKPRIF